jgi:hypothetical protein
MKYFKVNKKKEKKDINKLIKQVLMETHTH